MDTNSQKLSLTDVQRRISELDAIVENIAALKAERDDLRRALPALQNLAQRGDGPSAEPRTKSTQKAKTDGYAPKPGTDVELIYRIILAHPEGISEKRIMEECAKAGRPLSHGSVSSQLSQLRKKRKLIRKMKGLYYPK